MSSNKSSFSDEIGPAALRTTAMLTIALVCMFSLNIEYPNYAKGFDLPLVVLFAATIYVNPRLALFCGLAAGFVCDLYAGKLSVLHMAFYSIPGLVGPLIGEGVLFRSGTVAGILILVSVLFKFLLQYLLLFAFGQGAWPSAFLVVNWWGVVVLVGLTMVFWEKLGTWMAARPENLRFRRGIYGR